MFIKIDFIPFLLIFTFNINLVFAQNAKNKASSSTTLAECRINRPDIKIHFLIQSNNQFRVSGRINQDAFSCQLQLQEFQNQTRHINSSLRVLTRRQNESCSKETSIDVLRGLFDHIDLIIYQGSAELLLLEGHNAIPCSSYVFNQNQLIQFLQRRGSRSTDSVIPKRKTKPLKIKSLKAFKI